MDDTLEENVSNGLLCIVVECVGWGTYGNVTQDGEQDVDEEIRVAAALEEDAERGEEDGEDDLADVGGGERNVCGVFVCRRSK